MPDTSQPGRKHRGPNVQQIRRRIGAHRKKQFKVLAVVQYMLNLRSSAHGPLRLLRRRKIRGPDLDDDPASARKMGGIGGEPVAHVDHGGYHAGLPQPSAFTQPWREGKMPTRTTATQFAGNEQNVPLADATPGQCPARRHGPGAEAVDGQRLTAGTVSPDHVKSVRGTRGRHAPIQRFHVVHRLIPSITASDVRTSSRSPVPATTAASSPMPIRTPGADGSRSLKKAMSSDSPRSESERDTVSEFRFRNNKATEYSLR